VHINSVTCMKKYILKKLYEQFLLCKFWQTQNINNKYSTHNSLKNTKSIEYISDIIRVPDSTYIVYGNTGINLSYLYFPYF